MAEKAGSSDRVLPATESAVDPLPPCCTDCGHETTNQINQNGQPHWPKKNLATWKGQIWDDLGTLCRQHASPNISCRTLWRVLPSAWSAFLWEPWSLQPPTRSWWPPTVDIIRQRLHRHGMKMFRRTAIEPSWISWFHVIYAWCLYALGCKLLALSLDAMRQYTTTNVIYVYTYELIPPWMDKPVQISRSGNCL